MKRIVTLLLVIILTQGAVLFAQDTASVTWELSVNTASAFIASGGVNGYNQTSSELYVIRDYGGMETSQRVYSAGSGLGYWPDESGENLERYCEFTVYPRNGIAFQLTDVKMRIGNSGGSSNVRASIYYSTNNFETSFKIASALELPSKNLINVDINLSDSAVFAEFGSEIKVRVYPWLIGGVASGKYFNIRDVKLIGVTSGEIIPELAEVESTGVYKISTQSAIFKGKALNDGGVKLDSLGIVLSTGSNPDLTDSVYLTSPVTGSFEIELSNLTVDQTYFVKAFAINGAGVAYGKELSFKTLAKLSEPGVKTNPVSDLRPNGGVAHGNVFFDGGLDVTLSGFCFSKQVSPTLSDEVVEAGEGLGDFSAYLAGLDDQTTYYVRAFAVNNIGTGYGDQVQFTTPAPQPEINITVDKNGDGDYMTIQEAFDAVPSYYLGKITVFVKKGVYEEKVLLPNDKINVHLLGENRDSTIIRWNDYSGKVVEGVTLGTSTSYTVAVDADDFIAQNITFQNTYNGSQAVALRVKGDRMIFQQCKLLGYQDTYYTWGRGRVYHQDCYIEGTVDFIFGSSVAVFKNCTIKSLRNSPVTAASTEQGYKFGYVFLDSKITSSGTYGTTLGRPWKPYAQTVFINCEETEEITPAGWLEWEGTTNHLTCYYAEYECSGEGFKPDQRVSWSHQLTSEEAGFYTLENIYAKEVAAASYDFDWLPLFTPVDNTVDVIKPEGLHVLTNIYPNPVKQRAVIEYYLPEKAEVKINICSNDGRIVETIVDTPKEPGEYRVSWRPQNRIQGVYLCNINVNGKSQTKTIVVIP